MTEKNAKNANKFVCEKCDFICHKKSDWNRHISTKKHQTGDKMVTLVTAKNATLECIKCNKVYKSRNGLWCHKQKCVANTDNIVSDISDTVTPIANDSKIDVMMLLEMLKQSQDFQKQMLEQQKQMMELATNNNNNNNTTNNIFNANNSNNTNNSFNLNVFLNDTCKGAMNMSEFVDSIKMQLSDLENFAHVGYANGVSNIFVKGLNALGVHLRPIHCSDSKRETLYIKDNDEWIKETDERSVLKNAIKRVAFKNIKQINEWVKENPSCKDPTTKKYDQYNKIVMNAMSGVTEEEQKDNIEKIVRNVTKAVAIDKAALKQ
jgi:hypothetical protein